MIFQRIYRVIEKGSGEVYSAEIPNLEINKFSKKEFISLTREVNILSKLNHPAIIKFIGYSPLQKQIVCLLQDNCEMYEKVDS